MVQGCAHENYEYVHKHATNDTLLSYLLSFKLNA